MLLSANHEVVMKTNMSTTKAELKKLATQTFGDEKLASSWLKSNNLLLGMSPNEWLKLDRDADEIKRIINAIGYGGVV